MLDVVPTLLLGFVWNENLTVNVSLKHDSFKPQFFRLCIMRNHDADQSNTTIKRFHFVHFNVSIIHLLFPLPSCMLCVKEIELKWISFITLNSIQKTVLGFFTQRLISRKFPANRNYNRIRARFCANISLDFRNTIIAWNMRFLNKHFNCPCIPRHWNKAK